MPSFSQEIKNWRGKRLQKEVNDIFSVSLKTYQTWEQGTSEPSRLAMAEVRRRMGRWIFKK